MRLKPHLALSFFTFLRLKSRSSWKSSYFLTVIPAKAGIHRQYEAWIPAFAGMTVRHRMVRHRTVRHGLA
jgi:hypothetical protein